MHYSCLWWLYARTRGPKDLLALFFFVTGLSWIVLWPQCLSVFCRSLAVLNDTQMGYVSTGMDYRFSALLVCVMALHTRARGQKPLSALFIFRVAIIFVLPKSPEPLVWYSDQWFIINCNLELDFMFCINMLICKSRGFVLIWTFICIKMHKISRFYKIWTFL